MLTVSVHDQTYYEKKMEEICPSSRRPDHFKMVTVRTVQIEEFTKTGLLYKSLFYGAEMEFLGANNNSDRAASFDTLALETYRFTEQRKPRLPERKPGQYRVGAWTPTSMRD